MTNPKLCNSGASVRTGPVHDAILADFLEGIRSVRPQIGCLLLFGSRARGDHRTHSDYDVLVVVTRKSRGLLDALYESVLDVLLTHGRLISLKIFEEQEFARLQRLATPFTRRIAAEGQPLG
jgi:predicted nucleotidyltransferase